MMLLFSLSFGFIPMQYEIYNDQLKLDMAFSYTFHLVFVCLDNKSMIYFYCDIVLKNAKYSVDFFINKIILLEKRGEVLQ